MIDLEETMVRQPLARSHSRTDINSKKIIIVPELSVDPARPTLVTVVRNAINGTRLS